MEKKYYERVTVEEAAKNGVTFIATGKAVITDDKVKLEPIQEHLRAASHIPILTLYAIRNKEGKWFKSKGYGGKISSLSWVDKLENARIYSKAAPARGIISWWYNNFPDYGVPDLIVLPIVNTIVINQIDRVEKQKENKKKRELLQEKRNTEYKLKHLQKQKDFIEEEIKSLKK